MIEASDEYGAAAEYYDFVSPYAERPDLDFYLEMARESGGPVLEVGCGTGRVLLPTARAGTQITGLDLSQGMLDVLRHRLAAESQEVQARVRIVEGDMRDFELGQSFELITIPFRPFQHLVSVKDQMACLRTIHRHLNPGGRLVLDLFNPSIPLLADDARFDEQEGEPQFSLPDGRDVKRTFRITERNYFEQYQKVEMYYYVTHPDGRQERVVHAFDMRWLFRFEAEHLLMRCGFEVEHLYAGFDRSEYGSVYPGDLVFVTRRPND